MIFHFHTPIKVLLQIRNLRLWISETQKVTFLSIFPSGLSCIWTLWRPFTFLPHSSPSNFPVHQPFSTSIQPPHPWGETLLVDKFSSSVIQRSLTYFSPVLPLPLSLTLFASLSGHLSQEACWTDRWKALTFTQNNNKLLTLFSNVTFHLYAMEVTSNCLIITLELPL